MSKFHVLGEPVLLMIGQPFFVTKAYFDGACFRLTEYAFEYEVLPVDVMGWTYDITTPLSFVSCSKPKGSMSCA